MSTEHEGERLAAALAAHRVDRKRFAHAINGTTAYVSKLIHTARLGDGAWRTVRDGLAALKIDPGEVREMNRTTVLVSHGAAAEDYADAIRVLDELRPDEVEKVRRLLERPPEVLDVVRLLLARRKK